MKTRLAHRQFFGMGVLLAILMVLAPQSLAQDVVDGIAAIVNDKVITFSQVKTQVEPQEKALREALQGNPEELVKRIKALRLEALNALIERQLILQDFEKQGMVMPERIVDQRMEEIIKTQFDGNRSAFIKTMEAQKMTLQEYRRDLKDNVIVQYMRQRNVNSEIVISPFKIETYYQKNMDKFYREDQIRLRMIFFRKGIFKEKYVDDAGKEYEMDPQLKLAREVLKKLNTGSDFSNLARAYSEEPKRESGGDWGWIDNETLRDELAAVAFKLRPGQVSPIVVTDEGYYIMQCYDYRKGELLPLKSVRDRIEGELVQEERLELQRQWIDKLKEKAYIKMF
ncbi:MAG: peptidylprolyl isomerase [Verrucomicrobiae bacterium]|nr:peptidylprolyl isomerase [Verrucomicrobiae bacterium]